MQYQIFSRKCKALQPSKALMRRDKLADLVDLLVVVRSVTGEVSQAAAHVVASRNADQGWDASEVIKAFQRLHRAVNEAEAVASSLIQPDN